MFKASSLGVFLLAVHAEVSVASAAYHTVLIVSPRFHLPCPKDPFQAFAYQNLEMTAFRALLSRCFPSHSALSGNDVTAPQPLSLPDCGAYHDRYRPIQCIYHLLTCWTRPSPFPSLHSRKTFGVSRQLWHNHLFVCLRHRGLTGLAP